MAWNIRHINLERILKIIVLFESIYWLLGTVGTLLIYLKLKSGAEATYNEIKIKADAVRGDADADYAAHQERNRLVTEWVVPTAFALFLIQYFLYYGVTRKHRCSIFSWMVFNVVFGVTRVVIILKYALSPALHLAIWLWCGRLIFFYFAARFMLQITNEQRGEEEVEPPQFRPQSLDPREYREGLNYPSYPRSLQFADRMAGLNKLEHAHPKRWVPTYDAVDDDGRMVVVLDDPVYESI